MPEITDFPYPTVVEALRAIANALDLKGSNKSLDDEAVARVLDPRKVAQLLADICSTLEPKVGTPFRDLIHSHLSDLIENYTSLVGVVCADGLARREMLPLLTEYFWAPQLVLLLQKAAEVFPGLNPSALLSRETNAVSSVFKWAESSANCWDECLDGFSKEDKDRLRVWQIKENNELPSLGSVVRVGRSLKESGASDILVSQLCGSLLLARAMEYAKRSQLGCDLLTWAQRYLWGVQPSGELGTIISARQKSALNGVPELEHIAVLQGELRKNNPKEIESQDICRKALNCLRLVEAEMPEGSSYWLDWMEGRWYVLSGQLPEALPFYHRAFEDCLYRSGENQLLLAEEALVLAANLKNPDKVFLRRMKWSLVQFGYDIPSAGADRISAKFEDTVEDWEVKMWASHLKSVFPPQGMFPGCDQANWGKQRLGPLVYQEEPLEKLDLSKKRINKKVTVGDTWSKVSRQLILAIENRDYDATKTLLEGGADVNVKSDSDDTPLLLALEQLNVTNVPTIPPDERFFKLLSSYTHDPDIVNTRTQKKRLLPLISAIESGRSDVVHRVLQLGADVDRRGCTDEQTPLNVCLKYLNRINCPEKFLQAQMEHPLNNEALDSIRRWSNGAMGYTLSQVKASTEKFKSQLGSDQFRRAYIQIQQQTVERYMSSKNMREIAWLLIEAGADPNAEHSSPLKGYTPLMLAAENDERELFERMLVKGGNPRKSYINPRNGRNVDCWEIAGYFGSTEVYRLLEDIEPNLS